MENTKVKPDSSRAAEVAISSQQVFLLHGFARATMADIARAAGMSRPALYLIYPSKEEVFRAAVSAVFEKKLFEVKTGLSERYGIEAQVLHAFDIWTVQTYELLRTYPEAKDLFEKGLVIASEIIEKANDEFSTVLCEIMSSHLNAHGSKFETSRLKDAASVMTAASVGFKTVARDTAELRHLLQGLVRITVSYLSNQN